MYSANVSISPLPQSFRHEEAVLKQVGIQVWGQLSQLDELALNQLCSAWPRVSRRNLCRLRGIAGLVCDISLSPAEAALLMHAGIATVRALAKATPEQLVRSTGKLERQLGIGRGQGPQTVDLALARRWIRIAQKKLI